MSRELRTLASAVAIISAVALLLPGCGAAPPGATVVPPTPTAFATPTLRPAAEPGYPLPPTQVFPTPQATPTRGPTPQIPDVMATYEQSDIPYTSDQALDVYAPVSPNAWPVVVLLHGGNVNKKFARGLAIAVAGQGAVVFVPEYQSYEPPPDKIVTGAEEAACAIRFARAHGADYGGDANRIVVVGHSGGGAFGALMALAGDQFHGDCSVPEGSALPDTLIGLDGAYDLLRYVGETRLRKAPPEEWLRISPYAYIGSVPSRSELSFHLFVGLEEELLQDAQAFRDALQEAGYQVSLTQFPGVDHLRIASPRHANTVWAIVTLMRE